MSERTHAPRSGGRTTEQRSTAEARRRTGTAEAGGTRATGAAGGARGARSADPADKVRGARGAGAADKVRGARGAGAADNVRGARGAGAAGNVLGARSAGPVIDGVRARRRSAQAATGSPAATPDVLAAGAATQGATALKLDTAVAEPLRATETAPRLRVAPPAPISAPRAPFIAGVIALVVAGVLGILLINTKTNENSFEISRLREQKTALDTRQQQLENQLAVYDSTGNLSAAAKRLGLVKADTPAYIRLPDGKVIGVPRPGAGQPAVTAQDAADAAGTGTTPVQPNTPAGSTQGQPGQGQQGQQGQPAQGQQGQPVQGQQGQGLPAGAAPAQPGIQGGLVTGQPVVPVQPVVPGAGE